MIVALRNLFNFYEKQGLASKDWLNLLRGNIPKDEEMVDIKVPSEEAIVKALRGFKQFSGRVGQRALYNLVLDSGLRLVEAVKFMNDFNEANFEEFEGCYVAPMGQFRGSKLSYCALFTKYTRQLIQEVREVKELKCSTATSFVRNHRDTLIAHKYLRKFAFDAMISLEIPESVADFIQGRVPKKIGAKHYMALVRQAKKFYPRYAEYITQLRQKALN